MRTPNEVTVGIMTAIPVEPAAVRMVLDGARDHRMPDDPNHYCIGDIPSSKPIIPHRVAVALQARDGTRDAAGARSGNR